MESVNEIILFTELRNKLRRISETIIFDLNAKIKHTEEIAEQSLHFLDKVIQKLYEKHLDGEVNENSLEEIISIFGTDKERYRLRSYMINNGLISNKNINNSKKVVYPNGNIYEGQFKNSKRQGIGVYK